MPRRRGVDGDLDQYCIPGVRVRGFTSTVAVRDTEHKLVMLQKHRVQRTRGRAVIVILFYQSMIRIRLRNLDTVYSLGCSRGTVVGIQIPFYVTVLR